MPGATEVVSKCCFNRLFKRLPSTQPSTPSDHNFVMEGASHEASSSSFARAEAAVGPAGCQLEGSKRNKYLYEKGQTTICPIKRKAVDIMPECESVRFQVRAFGGLRTEVQHKTTKPKLQNLNPKTLYAIRPDMRFAIGSEVVHIREVVVPWWFCRHVTGL